MRRGEGEKEGREEVKVGGKESKGKEKEKEEGKNEEFHKF